jgi:hypothetical protein
MEISVSVIPNAKSNGIEKLSDEKYKARVDAPAEGGRANARLVEMLAEYFNVRRAKVRIISGMKNKNKTVSIDID